MNDSQFHKGINPKQYWEIRSWLVKTCWICSLGTLAGTIWYGQKYFELRTLKKSHNHLKISIGQPSGQKSAEILPNKSLEKLNKNNLGLHQLKEFLSSLGKMTNSQQNIQQLSISKKSIDLILESANLDALIKCTQQVTQEQKSLRFQLTELNTKGSNMFHARMSSQQTVL